MTTLTHLKAQGLMQQAADRPLSAWQKALLESHLAGCAACHAYMSQLNQLKNDLGDFYRNSWNVPMPKISSKDILQRSRSVANRRNLYNAFSTAGMVIVVLGVLLLADAFLRRPISFPSVFQQSTRTQSLSPGSNSFQETPIPVPFPPPGIGAICTSTATSPQMGDGKFIWPAQDHITAGKDFSEVHPAIDLSGAVGDPVWAADGGVVIMAGWNTWGYGNLVILDHGNGWYSLYGHLDMVSVKCGQNVLKGQLLGIIGISGNTKTPQLHFQVLKDSNFVNPRTILPISDDCDRIVYIVQQRDTLYQIATLFNVTVESIRSGNHLGNQLPPGTTLVIKLCHK